MRFWCYCETLKEANHLVDAIGLNCVIGRAREDKVSSSQLVAGAWRGLSTWGRLGLESLLLFVYSNLFSSESIYCLEGGGEVFRRVLRFHLR